MLFESQYATSYAMINSNLGPISQRLATIARNGLKDHPCMVVDFHLI